MQSFQPLFLFNLPIPVWQIALYVALMSFFLINHKIRLSLATSYLFILFWLYFSFRADLLLVTKEDFVAQAAYTVFGFVLLGLGLFAYFFVEGGKETLLENLSKRNGEIADLKLKLKKAEKRVHGLETQAEEAQRSFQAQEAALAKQLEEELNADIAELEHRLKDRENLLEHRNEEIADLKSTAKEAEKNARALKTQVEEMQRSLEADQSTVRKSLEKEFNKKIADLEHRLEDGANLLEKRNGEIAELKSRAKDAEKSAQALTAQVEDGQRKADEAEKSARALKTQIEEAQRSFQAERSAAKKALEKEFSVLEKEFNTTIGDLERRLKDGESLLEKRNGEIADLKSKAKEAEQSARALTAQVEDGQRKADEAEKSARALKTQIEEAQRSSNAQDSTAKKQLEKELNAKIGELEHRLKDGASLLEERNGEIADLKATAKDAEKNFHALKTQIEESQAKAREAEKGARGIKEETHRGINDAARKKLEKEFNAKIADLEHQLKSSENLLEKRNGEIADLKSKTKDAEKSAHALKSQVEEAQLKAKEAEKGARTLKAQVEDTQRSLHAEQSALMKKLADDLNGKIADLQRRLEDREGLLEKRNGELAGFKQKAEEAEKSARALKKQAEETERSLNTRESTAKKQLADELNAKIADVEQRLKDRESLLEKRNEEIADFRRKAVDAEKSAWLPKSPDQKDRQGLPAQISKNALEQALKNNKTLEKQLKDLEEQIRNKDNLLSLMAKRNGEIADLKLRAEEAEKKVHALKDHNVGHDVQVQDSNNKSLEQELKNKVLELKQLREQVNHKEGLLGLMAKRNLELADLKSKADERIEALEAQLQEGRPMLHAQDSGNGNSHSNHQNHRP
jgi:chromosome segregation ATPase